MPTAREVISRIYEKPPYIIDENLLHEKGLMFIGGPPKAYKSFLLNSLCYHLTTGTNLFGAFRSHANHTQAAFLVNSPKRVLLFEQEIGEFSLKDRLKPLADSLADEQQALFLDSLYVHSCDRSLRLDQEPKEIEAVIAKVKPDIVCLDPLIEFHHREENSASEMQQVMRGLDYLRDKYGVAIIVTHHCGKPGDRLGADQLRGSSAIFGKGDSYIMLSVHNRASGIIRLEFVVRRGIPIRSLLVKLDWTDLRIRFHDWYSTKSAKSALESAYGSLQ